MASNNITYPGIDLLKNLYSDLYNSLIKTSRQKLLDSNKMRSNLADPHTKTIVAAADVNRLIFAGAFGKKFTVTERTVTGVDMKKSSPVFTHNLKRLEEVFGGSFIKCHGSGDISMVTPWFVLEKEKDTNFLLKGALLLRLEDLGDIIKLFVPCAGLD